jgi:hypothetical protein
MGGIGCGSWYRWQGAKATVDDCRSIDVARWVRERIIEPGVTRAGGWQWTRDGEVMSSIGYSATAWEDGAGFVVLDYSIGSGDDRKHLRYTVDLRTTRPYYGGMRWWFTCPLAVVGRPCTRRAGKLYLRGGYFGCRQCQDLTYRSCQEAHQAERARRMLARLRARPGGLNPFTARDNELIAWQRATRHAERPR